MNSGWPSVPMRTCHHPAIAGVFVWTHIVANRRVANKGVSRKGVLPNIVEVGAILAVIAATWFAGEGRDGVGVHTHLRHHLPAAAPYQAWTYYVLGGA